ncbi:MAG: dCMP deaminase family protein [Gaiellales bacterium]
MQELDPRRPDLRAGARRPTREEYFMLLAVATRQRAECLGRHVGAVLVRDGRIIATGYNGTPRGFPRCTVEERGCHRCAEPASYPAGTAYDVCICVHAEQNALLQAARLGYTSDGAVCFTTLRPCFGCLKELHQGGIVGVRYQNEWAPRTPELRVAYDDLLVRLAERGMRVEHLALDDELLDLRGARER